MNSGVVIKDSILEGLSLAVAVFDSEMRLELANSAFSRLWKLEMTWLGLRPNLLDIYEKLREERCLPEVSDFKAFKQQEIYKFRTVATGWTDTMYLPDGRSIQRQANSNGKGGLVYSFEDVTNYQKLQRSVKEMGAVQSETLDNLHEGVVVFGSDGKLKLYNPIYSKFWGFQESFLSSHPHLSDVIELTKSVIVPWRSEKEWEDSAWVEYKTQTIANILGRVPSEGRLRLTTGIIVDYSYVPLPDGAILLSYLDVTDNDKIEKALLERAQALEDANQIKSEFIANVSREIHTPLNTIIGYADMLEQGYFGKLNLRQEEYASGIVSTSKGLVKVVSDILRLAKLDAGQMDLKMEPIDIHQLLFSALNLIKNRAKQKQLKIGFNCATDIGWMTGDKEYLKQILYKLLSNSVAFTHPHGELLLGAKREEGYVVISLSDSGIGIPNKLKANIFEPFYRVNTGLGNELKDQNKDCHDEFSAGLGLTVVKRFVERHNGTIEVKSLMGRGTRVTCRFLETNN